MKKKYIHYGSDRFDPDRFEDISNWEHHHVCKPHGGLWAAPIEKTNKNRRLNWKEWCEANDYRTERLESSFEFSLTSNAKVLYLNDVIHKDGNNGLIVDDKSLEKAIHICDPFKWIRRDRERVIEDLALEIDFWYLKNLWNYDAIEVKIDSIFYWLLYGWDVDSLLVLNPNCIVVQQ